MLPKRILVVDDDESVTELCRRILSREGHEVVCAESGEEAAHFAGSGYFHMVLMDMLMPGMNGLETFMMLREKQQGILGVLITGYGTMETAIQAMEMGFSGFVEKPFEPAALMQAVEESFEKATLSEESTRLKTLIPLYSLGEKFITSETRGEVLEELIEAVSQQTGAHRISVMLYDETEACLRIAASEGIEDEIVRRAKVKPGERIAGRVFQSGEPLILNGGPDANPEFASFLIVEQIEAAISFPLKARDRTVGVLNVGKAEEGSAFSQADAEMLCVICSQAVMALENVRIMKEREERLRVRTLLEQYVAPEVAELLLSHQKNPLEVGEMRSITVLFADIRNFTGLVQNLPLDKLRSFLNDFFDLLTEAVFKFHGTLDKFMGDAALAMFGAPIALRYPNHAAVSAAVEMMGRFGELKASRKARDDHFDQIGLGIGISSGEMFLGTVGSQKRLDYTVIGTDVNLSQRLASNAASGEILISESAAMGLDEHFYVTPQPSRPLKGLDTPSRIFTVARPWAT